MTHTRDTWPTFSEELTRKSAGTLDKWMSMYDRGKISARELFILVDGLWDAVSGLVETDFLRTLEAIHQELRMGARKEAA